MANKERGGLSKREYARKMAAQGGGGEYGDFYNAFRDSKNSMLAQTAQITGDPNTNKMSQDLYLQQGGAILDRGIKDASNKYYAEALDAMGRYDNIQNPHMRRALAEKSQSVEGIAVTGLTDERTRRQQVIDDYVQTWSQTYGAKAKASQSAAKFQTITDAEATTIMSQLKSQGATWEELAEYMRDEYGYDTSTGSHFDVQAHTLWDTGHYPTKPTATTQKEKELTPKQQLDNDYYQTMIEAQANPEKYEIDEEGNIYEITDATGFMGRSTKSKKLIARKVK
jgi:hypothetical protein